jgi:Na+/H+ antiporter NhaD/arsenite permease-like protein
MVFVGFMTHGQTGMPVAVPALIGAATLLVVQDVLYLRTHRPTPSEREHGLLEVVEREIEWPTLAFFVFLFIVVGAAVQTGLMDTVAAVLSRAIARGQAGFGLSGPATLVLAALVICWASGVLSGLVDNIPFVAVAIPIVARLSGQLPGSGNTLWWALALGACLGGNATAIGASANVTVIGIAERQGTRIRFAEFARFGVPVTAMSLGIASLFLVGWVYLSETRVRLIGLLLLGILLAIGRVASRAATSTATPRS